MKKVLSILLSLAIVTGSIGFHVIEHHCVWCGGDKVEFVAIGLPAHNDDSCCGDQCSTTGSHDCHEDGCCNPEFLTLQTGLMDEGGLSLLKSGFTIVDFTPALIISTLVPNRLYASSNLSVPPDTDVKSRPGAGPFALRC